MLPQLDITPEQEKHRARMLAARDVANLCQRYALQLGDADPMGARIFDLTAAQLRSVEQHSSRRYEGFGD